MMGWCECLAFGGLDGEKVVATGLRMPHNLCCGWGVVWYFSVPCE